MSNAAAHEPGDMNRSQEDHMRPHITQRNTSSSSLEGLERPVRSFKSFIQTTPPHPTETDKALPLTPALWKATHSSEELTPTSASTGHSSPWKAPAEWFHDSESGEHSLALTSSLSPPRSFTPLIPDPSPSLSSKMTSEPTAWLASSSHPISRLVPIYERTDGSPDLGPPSSPPRSPLPAPPSFKDRSVENRLLPGLRRTNRSPNRKVVNADLRVQALPRLGSDAASNEKAYASLGIKPPLLNTTRGSSSSQKGWRRADRQYFRSKKLRALFKGSPLSEDSWEDEDMDNKTRELSFSQDYHDLLVDRYQEMNVYAEEVLSTGGIHQVYEAQLEKPGQRVLPAAPPIVARPLSWQKSYSQSTPHSPSQDREVEQPPSSGQKSKHKRISSLISHLNVLEPNKDTSKKERGHSKTEHTPGSEADKSDDELRFLKFLPTGRPIKFGKKHKKPIVARVTAASSSPPQSGPFIRLPGGLAVIRTHSYSPDQNSDILSDKSPMSAHTRGSSQSGSENSRGNSDHGSSYNSRHSQSPANIPATMRTAYRTSEGSSYSHRSSTGHPPPAPPALPPAPTPPTILSSVPLSPSISLEALNRLRSQEKTTEHRRRSNFIEKAKEARRRRLKKQGRAN